MTSNPRHSEHGYALIAVVGIVGVLAVIAMALTERARVGASAASEFLEETRDLYAVQAGIALAERVLAGKSDMGQDGQLRLELAWDERHLNILISDEAKKIDVNRASLKQLSEGFAALGASPDDAITLASRTIDWRDSDERPTPRGAEAPDYFAAGLLFQPRNDRFVSLDEVGTVLGMPPDVADWLHTRFAVIASITPVAPTSARIAAAGRKQQIIDDARLDGLTRLADVQPNASSMIVELHLRRVGEIVERMHPAEPID